MILRIMKITYQLIQILLLTPFYQACINQIVGNTLYKIRNEDFSFNQFYMLKDMKDIYGATGATNSSHFLWYLVKHPTIPATFMFHNLNFTDHVWQLYPELTDWNPGIVNCSNENQWFKLHDYLGEENTMKCVISIKDPVSQGCFVLQGSYPPYLEDIDCSLRESNGGLQAPETVNVFEFIRMSDARDDLQGKCSKKDLESTGKKRICKKFKAKY